MMKQRARIDYVSVVFVMTNMENSSNLSSVFIDSTSVTFSQSDDVIRLAARAARSERVHGRHAKTVHRIRQEAHDLSARAIGQRHQGVVHVPIAVLADPGMRR